jgi:hypothetical protein
MSKSVYFYEQLIGWIIDPDMIRGLDVPEQLNVHQVDNWNGFGPRTFLLIYSDLREFAFNTNDEVDMTSTGALAELDYDTCDFLSGICLNPYEPAIYTRFKIIPK